MKQMTLAVAKGFEVHGRATRKAAFLARMEALVPWGEFCALIEPHYAKVGNGRPPIGVERMLRMYCVANWFNLADEACEDALYDVPAFRDFCRIDLGRERVLDATTLLKFRHLLEEKKIGAALFTKVGELLLANGMTLSGGTIVDATLIAAPPSTKNRVNGSYSRWQASKRMHKYLRRPLTPFGRVSQPRRFARPTARCGHRQKNGARPTGRSLRNRSETLGGGRFSATHLQYAGSA